MVRFILLAVFFCLSSSVSAALTIKDLSVYDEQIFLDPAGSYETLKANGPVDTSAPKDIWLLLRRAQAENALSIYDDMISTLNKASAYESQMDIAQHALLKYLQGVHAHINGDLNGSLKLLSESIQLVKSTPNSNAYALATRELGYVYALSGDYYQANLTLHNAYNTLIVFNNRFFNALIEESLGDTYNYSGKYSEAVNLYQSALAHFQVLKYRPFISSTLLGMALVKRRLEEWQEALTLFDQYEESISFASNYGQLYFLHYGRAITLAEMGECTRAVEAIDFALTLDGILDYDAELYKRRARCNLALGKTDLARIDLEKARKILDQFEDLQGSQWTLELDYIEGLIAAEKQNYQQAYELTSSYFTALQSLQEKSNSERLLRMQTGLEGERKDSQIALLQKQAELKQAEAQTQSLQVQKQQLLLVGSVLAGFALLVFILFQFRHSRKLLELSIRDDLTYLHNRRYFFDFIANIDTNEAHNTNGMTLMIFDIDNFKLINDMWGHQSGDQVIIQLSHRASSILRTHDLLCRIGGDEFYVLLPRTRLNDAEEIAERLLAKVNGLPFQLTNNKSAQVSISIGLAHTSAQSLNIDELIESADKALYQAKYSGKNQLYTAK